MMFDRCPLTTAYPLGPFLGIQNLYVVTWENGSTFLGWRESALHRSLFGSSRSAVKEPAIHSTRLQNCSWSQWQLAWQWPVDCSLDGLPLSLLTVPPSATRAQGLGSRDTSVWNLPSGHHSVPQYQCHLHGQIPLAL